ncbi:MAG: nucleoside-triphosphatase [Anaerovoracaceae bacterium]
MVHLFLEGPVQSGKSTLLRKYLAPYIDQIGGFSCQRLVDTKGLAVAYRLILTNQLELTKPYDPNLSNIFLRHNLDSSEKDLSIFKNIGIPLIENSMDKKAILLDEIGGIELLQPDFKKALYRVLKKETPCIGVLKLNEKTKYMAQNGGLPSETIRLNSQLRYDLIHEFDAKIVDIKDIQKTEKAIAAFLERIF